MACHLLSLPHEVLHHIFSKVDAQDIAALRCCRALKVYVNDDTLLFKELYLQQFVGPIERTQNVQEMLTCRRMSQKR